MIVARCLLLACVVGFVVDVGCGPRGAVIRDQLGACELGKLPTVLESLAVDVTAVLFGGSSWETQLQALGAQAGADQLHCVVQAVGAGLRARATKGQVSGEYAEAVRRADAWLARP